MLAPEVKPFIAAAPIKASVAPFFAPSIRLPSSDSPAPYIAPSVTTLPAKDPICPTLLPTATGEATAPAMSAVRAAPGFLSLNSSCVLSCLSLSLLYSSFVEVFKP